MQNIVLSQELTSDERITIKLFSLLHLIVAPTFVAYVAIYDYWEKLKYFDSHTDVLVMYVVAILFHLGISILSIDAGSEIWLMEKDGAKKVRRFWYIFITYWVVVNYLPLFAFIPEALKQSYKSRLFGGFEACAAWTVMIRGFMYKSKTIQKVFEIKEEQQGTPTVA